MYQAKQAVLQGNRFGSSFPKARGRRDLPGLAQAYVATSNPVRERSTLEALEKLLKIGEKQIEQSGGAAREARDPQADIQGQENHHRRDGPVPIETTFRALRAIQALHR